MLPYFNTAGPCVPGEHYMLDPGKRFAHVMRLVDERKYFTLHAGRQTGKTTSVQWLVDTYNKGDRYCALWVDIQTAREEPEPEPAFRTIFNKLDFALEMDWPELLPQGDKEKRLRDPKTALLSYLADVCSRSTRPVVVFFDEADGLIGATMVSFLTQLRDGYIRRAKAPFPHSIALVGMRQVRDYVLKENDRQAVSWLGTTSPFNITAEASTLELFSHEDVAELLAQHTQATGQVTCRKPWSSSLSCRGVIRGWLTPLPTRSLTAIKRTARWQSLPSM